MKTCGAFTSSRFIKGKVGGTKPKQLVDTFRFEINTSV